MSDESVMEQRVKKDRSPSFPFISLAKAVDRAQALYDGHRREAARLVAVAPTWGYGPKSSGLQQTVAALKQYGLIEDLGSGEDRKIQLTELARRILVDMRPGAREQALKEAARTPRLIAEYLPRWLPERPSDAHCISELHLDRGFNLDAARLFLRVFDETVSYAELREDDSLSVNGPLGPSAEDGNMGYTVPSPAIPSPVQTEEFLRPSSISTASLFSRPLSERLEVKTTGNRLTVNAMLVSGAEVDKLIRILQANKLLLDDEDETPSSDTSEQ